jgi:formylglycine-generating enzyme required for sulfatase activity
MDQTLLENRARKWIDMGKPWFGGLASGRELRDFRRAGVPTPQAKSYLSASNRSWWMKAVTGLALALVFGFMARAWQEGLSVEHTWLKLKSTFAGIQVEPEMVEVKADAFQMGDVAGRGDKDEQPVHEVKIQKSFKLGKHEVTFDEYDRFALATGRGLPFDQGWGRGRRPVINVAWEDARDFADWLSKQTGKRYRLPNEAEWEYAARSGGKDEVWAGTSDAKELGEYAVFAKGQTERVDEHRRKPNGLGLYDMSGNVWEWVQDCYHINYDGAPLDGTAWEQKDPKQCGQRVFRGGSWSNGPVDLRTSARSRGSADDRSSGDIGFRLAQDIP